MNAPGGAALDALRVDAQQRHRDLKARISRLSDDAIALILSGARSHYAWQDRPIPDGMIEAIIDLTLAGPTSMNTLPARFVLVETPEGKDRLARSLKAKNIEKMMSAPLTVIVAYDLHHWTHLPRLFPHEDRRHLFDGKPDYSEDTAYRNGTLQGAYFMIAARALGLDVGAMSGFSNEIVDQEFFAGTTLRSNFLCNLGYADETALFQKLPRFSFDDVVTRA
ncbi:malonic semialdehyde reductase [Anianabacter salinae]|uniref:malonic semialdehyde reductase n=1 Tax=Anianabacter salinae TaxID=2851023 RepID=UPI00225E0EFE|nr:malonic semialdehyde reductase [Anianabacter salinae]MBV0911094.1 malonic semialdehyde reductase [Anianabacter salinae]